MKLTKEIDWFETNQTNNLNESLHALRAFLKSFKHMPTHHHR